MSRRSRTLQLATVAVVLVVTTAVLPGCGSNNYRVYNGHGVSFHYPRDWRTLTSNGINAQSSSGLWTEMFGPNASGSTADIVFMTEFRTSVPVTDKNLAASAGSVTASVARVAQAAGGALLAGPTEMKMGGLPGYGFRMRAITSRGRKSASRLVIVWNGKTEYFLNCQHLVSGTRGKEIERGCKMIVASFKLG